MKTLIRLGGCPGWSESSLGAQVTLLVLSCGGSDIKGEGQEEPQAKWIAFKWHYDWENRQYMTIGTKLRKTSSLFLHEVVTMLKLDTNYNSAVSQLCNPPKSHDILLLYSRIRSMGGILFSVCPSFRHAVMPWFRPNNSFPLCPNNSFPLNVLRINQILHIHWYWQDLCCHCYASIGNRVITLDGPWLTSEFRFRSISIERIEGIRPSFGYALILTRSRLLGLPIFANL